MGLKEILLLVCIMGGFIVLIYSIKHICNKYIERQKHNNEN